MAAVRLIGLLAAGWSAAVLAAGPLPLRVTADRVILRASPHAEGEIVGQVMAGDVLAATELPGTQSWIRVAAPPSVDLWVYAELIRDGRIAVNKVQVRGGPGIQFQRVGELARGDAVTVRGTVGDWARIAPPEGCHLWIHRDFVATILPPTPAPPSTVPGAAPPPSTTADAPVVTNGAGLASAPEEVPCVGGAPQSSPPTAAAAAPLGAPSLGAPPPRPTLPPPLPPPLAGTVADAHRPQHEPRRFSGILTRVPYATGPRYSAMQLVNRGTGRKRGPVLCRLIGLDGQLESLVGIEVDAAGHVWHLAGEPIPVLDVRRLTPSQPLDP
jgi:hypothetical protein